MNNTLDFNSMMKLSDLDNVKRNAVINGDNQEEAIKIFEKEFKKKHGGARSGAGRKPGKWAKAKGKSKTNLICCYVTDDLKQEYLRQAKEKGLNQTQYLIWLIENNKSF